MSNIQVLSEDVRNLIAAGEVVERPASVVKELVENSIDAGASEIKVEITNGGLDKIIVADDGLGMDKADLICCVERHATSKLKNSEDLNCIKTMGFRGEALPSIAQVSRLSIESRPASGEVETGHALRLEGGKNLGTEMTGCPNGTRVTVSDLFYNVPARKKFLKSVRTETGHIRDMIERLALARPDIRYQLFVDGKQLMKAVVTGDLSQRASEIFGGDLVKKSYRCEADAGELRIYGLVGDPSLAQDGSRGIYWFVNGRPIRDRILSHAVVEAYRSLVPKGTTPFSMLFISINPDLVDVNVHPTKNEVRFLKSGAVHDFVLNVAKKTIEKFGARRQIGEYPEKSDWPADKPSEKFNWQPAESAAGFFCEVSPERSVANYGLLNPIGQLANTYILCEGAQGALVVIDQHAAHERIGYEKLKKAHASKSVQSQRLLVPEVIVVSTKSAPYLEDALPELNSIGFEIDHFGAENFCIKATPTIIGNINVKTVISAIAEELAEFGAATRQEDKVDAVLKLTACHAQVRAGEKLEVEEVRHLLKEMDEYEWTGRCPHGRPAVVEFGANEVAKWFKRL